MLKINNLYKSFKNLPVLNNINLSIEKDSIVGLAGQSGSGKSTLLRCIQGLEKIDQGTIHCDGQTGFVFQDFQLFAHMTILQNLIYAPTIMHKNEVNDHIKDAMKILESLGIKEKMDHYPHQLSGGQKQRAALARSLMMRPDCLLCDEPTSGLDIVSIMDVIELLKAVKEMGVTMIIASHDLQFLANIAQRMIILKNGNIILDTEEQKLKNDISFLKKHY